MAAHQSLGIFSTLPLELREEIWNYAMDDILPTTDRAVSNILKQTSLSCCSKQIRKEVGANVLRSPLEFTLFHVHTPAELTPRVLVRRSLSSNLREVYAFPRHIELHMFNTQDYDPDARPETRKSTFQDALSAWRTAIRGFPIEKLHTLMLSFNLTQGQLYKLFVQDPHGKGLESSLQDFVKRIQFLVCRKSKGQCLFIVNASTAMGYRIWGSVGTVRALTKSGVLSIRHCDKWLYSPVQ